MTSAGPAEDLKDAIRWRVNFITSDCNTFVLVKSQHPDVIGTWDYGGGNFLMASGLFALVNLLSKVHRYLVDPGAFVTDDYRAQVESARAGLVSEHPELKDILNRYLRA